MFYEVMLILIAITENENAKFSSIYWRLSTQFII